MSAGVCGKRLGFEEIFGSSSPTSSSSKRFRCSSFGSPIRSSEFGFGPDDKLSFLIRMFPSMDRQLVGSVLNNHDQKVDDAIESLRSICLGDICQENELSNSNTMVTANDSDDPGVDNIQLPEQKVEELQDSNTSFESKNPTDGSSWVDIIVQEMSQASDMDDARGRAARILEAFERSVVAHSRASDERIIMEQQQELVSLKEHLQSLLRDNQILKRAVSIQHERNVEQEEKTREVEQLKHVISQYQDQIRNLEINNYTLKLHLQRAEESSSIPGRFHPDIF